MHNPKEVHLQATTKFSTIKANIEKKNLFKKSKGLVLEAYIDADYTVSSVNKHSTCYYTFFCGNLVIWRSKKQNV